MYSGGAEPGQTNPGSPGAARRICPVPPTPRAIYRGHYNTVRIVLNIILFSRERVRVRFGMRYIPHNAPALSATVA